MAIPWVPIPEGTRIRVRQNANFPQEHAILGRAGTVVFASEYAPHIVGIALDGAADLRYFAPEELEVTNEAALPAEREAAKQRRALP
jgi:hypothetical protein